MSLAGDVGRVVARMGAGRMARFVRFDTSDGAHAAINPDHVVKVQCSPENGEIVTLDLANGKSIHVRGTVEGVSHQLSGSVRRPASAGGT
jgi:uncharacterized protein YlzI (FlbEa/FlbD family)